MCIHVKLKRFLKIVCFQFNWIRGKNARKYHDKKQTNKQTKRKRYDHFQGYSTDNQCKLLKYSYCYDPLKTLLLITALFYSRKYFDVIG